MSAGLPFLVLSVLAWIILSLWGKHGPGPSRLRRSIAVTMICSLALCWVALLSVGVFAPIGSFGIQTGFLISIASFFVPWLWRMIIKYQDASGE